MPDGKRLLVRAGIGWGSGTIGQDQLDVPLEEETDEIPRAHSRKNHAEESVKGQFLPTQVKASEDPEGIYLRIGH
jgi:hypothetical protein